MVQIKVCYDRKGSTLTVWFGDPESEYVTEETGDEIVLMKNERGEVIGFEKLNFVTPQTGPLSVAFETLAG